MDLTEPLDEDVGASWSHLQPFVDAEREFVQLTELGDHDAAVRCLESVLRQEQASVQQMQDTVLSTLFERLAVGYNTLGMKYLKEGRPEVSCKFFEKAEALTDPANLHMNAESRIVLRAVTYNNMGCFYKSMGKLHTSLQFLRKAKNLEEKSNGRCENPAGTHLNLCALLSQMGKHAEALDHSRKAISLLEKNPPSGSSSESLIGVAYFNMGAEFEHLKKTLDALWAYERAHQCCLSELGEDHALSKKISECLAQLRAKSNKKKNGDATCGRRIAAA